MRLSKQRSRDGEPLLLPARHLHSAFTNHRVEPLVGAREKCVSRSLMKNVETLFVCRVRTHEEKVLPDRSREKLGILRHETDSLSQAVEIDDMTRQTVVQNLALLRRIKS